MRSHLFRLAALMLALTLCGCVAAVPAGTAASKPSRSASGGKGAPAPISSRASRSSVTALSGEAAASSDTLTSEATSSTGSSKATSSKAALSSKTASSKTPSSKTASSSKATSSAPSSSKATSSRIPPAPIDFGPEGNQVIACDQVKNRVVVYDMATYDGTDLDNHEVWSYKPSGGATNISGVKYRRNTVFGDVVLIVCSGGYAGVIEYPSKKVIWSTSYAGDNPHSIEILPSGNIVTAASSGSTLRLYAVSALLDGGTQTAASRYVPYSLTDAHGVLWDPKGEVLWALGSQELKSYTLQGDGTSQTLAAGTKGAKLPSTGGHDLSADMGDINYLWVTVSNGVYHFNKSANAFEKSFTGSKTLSRPNVKGFGNNINGNFFFCLPNGGRGTAWSDKSYASWCTNIIQYAVKNGSGYSVTQCKSSTCAYYKVFCFSGRYQ